MRFHTQSTGLILAGVGTLLTQSVASLPTNSQTNFPRYEYGVERSTFVKRQSTTLPIVGVQTGSGPSGSTAQRQEIRDLENDETLWTLYILGLDMMQYTNQSDMQSWYSIMGIHGRPFLPYDNVQATPGNANNGYCTHVSILFPTWHRPYLALYEQVLHGMIQDIAAMWPAGPDRDRYMAAAPNFRIPYWDWAAVPASGQSVLPTSVSGSPGIEVNGPAGYQKIANPLYSYKFQPLNPSELPDAPFNVFEETLRYPTTQDNSAVSQNSLVAKQLDNNAASFRSRLYNLFTNYPDYSKFSNEAWIPDNDPGSYDSIESVHDQIHGLSGSGGHMSYIDYSAFDPLFMLHHTMVDRVFAMWQALYPDSFVVPVEATFSTFTITAGQTADVSTSLEPFHNTAGGFWDSTSARSTQTFGYTYPELSDAPGTNITKEAVTAINTLYGPNSANSKLAIVGNRDLSSRTTADGVLYREWITNILVQKHSLNSPFFINVFLGNFSDDPFSWSFEPNLVGTHCVFDKTASSDKSVCNCTSDFVTGTIPLTDRLTSLVISGDLKTLDPVDVEPYLATNLKYRISLLNDTEVANTDPGLSSLKISVASATVEKAAGVDGLPIWGNMTTLVESVSSD